MNCETAIETLPWLLNGSLDAPEREEVRRHLKECAACRLALAETREAWETFDQHLPTEAIVALAYDETPSGPAGEEALGHLAGCARCAAELELARTSRRLEEEENLLPFAARRQESGGVASTSGAHRRWQASALAAGLAGAVGLAGWLNSGQQVRTLREQLAARGGEAPAAAGPLVIATADPVVLDPLAVRQRAEEGSELTVPAHQGSALQLNGDAGIEPAERASIAAYRVEVWRAEGPKVGEAEVRYLAEGNYAVTVQGLPPGAYELRVFGRSAEGEKPCETYRFKAGA